MRKICVVSSGRADYSLLCWPMREIQIAPDMELQTIITGMHLSPEFGMTIKNFKRDGFPVSSCVEMLLSGDSSVAVTKSLGLGVIGFADALLQLEPDLLMLLGDRFEILAAAQAALIARIPVAHLYGGDTTEGAFDESIRHCITKMAHLHFVSNEEAAKRVQQMGENPAHVYNIGATCLDAIRRTTYLDRNDFFHAIKFKPLVKNLLITFHPVTLGKESSCEQFRQFLLAMHTLSDEVGLLFTRPNADCEGRKLNIMLDEFLDTHSNAKAYDALGNLYLSALKHVDAVAGNSSSGLYEAPSFGIATVNVGDRQKGRVQADSILNCAPYADVILETVIEALDMKVGEVVNPYGDGNSSIRIIEVIRSIGDSSALLQKHFYMTGKSSVV